MKISKGEELRQMVSRYIHGKASREEIVFLEAYYDYFDDLSSEWDDLTTEEKNTLKTAIFSEVQKELRNEKRQTIGMFGWYAGIAAAVLLLIGAGLFWFRSVETPAPSLTANVPEATQMEEIVTSEEDKHIYLPDGSYVILKKNSRLEYIPDFEGDLREVRLEGEAYFDVQPDAERPFMVYAGGVTTRVLGTAFSISSHAEQHDFSITVTRGRVAVSDPTRELRVLEKSDQFNMNLVTGEVTTRKIGEEQTTGLEPSEFRMDDLTLYEVAEIISRRWNCDFRIDDPGIGDCRVTTYFTRHDQLEEVVAVISAVIGVEYVIEDNRVSLRGKGCRK